jgi:hypothetical protein
MKTLPSHHFQADLDETTGDWLSLTASKWNQLPLVGKGIGFDLLVDGKPLWGKRQRQVSSFRYFAEGRGGAFIYQVSGLSLTHSIELDAALPVIYQSVLVQVEKGAERHLDAVLYSLPGFTVGNSADCIVHVPGSHFAKGQPYQDVDVEDASAPAKKTVAHHGLFAIERQAAGRIASCWLVAGDKAVQPTVTRSGDALTVTQTHSVQRTIQPGKTVVSQGFCLLITEGTLDEHLAEFKKVAY